MNIFYDKWPFRCKFHNFTNMVYELKHKERPSIHYRLLTKGCISAASEHAYVPEPTANQSEGLWAAVSKKLDAFYRFSRPHTVIGTVSYSHFLFFINCPMWFYWLRSQEVVKMLIFYHQIIGIVSVSLLPVQSIADLSPTYLMGLLKVT